MALHASLLRRAAKKRHAVQLSAPVIDLLKAHGSRTPVGRSGRIPSADHGLMALRRLRDVLRERTGIADDIRLEPFAPVVGPQFLQKADPYGVQKVERDG